MTKAYSRSPLSTYPARLAVPFKVPVLALMSPTACGAVLINLFFKVPEIPPIGNPPIRGANFAFSRILIRSVPTCLAVIRFKLESPLAS